MASFGGDVRRSLRVATMTPSKLGLMRDELPSEADSEATVKPLKLLGQQKVRGRSRSRSPASSPRRSNSRNQTPSKPSMPSAANLPRGQLPVRLDPSNNYGDTLLDSRRKQARNLAANGRFLGEETPAKMLSDPLQFGEWPTDPLITPAVMAHKRAASSNEETVMKLPKLPASQPSIFLNNKSPQRRKSVVSASKPIISQISLPWLASILILCLGFITTLFYGDEIGLFLSHHLRQIKWSPGSDELEAIRRDMAHISKLDIAGLLDRLDQLESRGVSTESLLANLRTRLVDVQRTVQSLGDWKDSNDRRMGQMADSLKSVSASVSQLEHQAKSTSELIEAQSEQIKSNKVDTNAIINEALTKFERILPEKLLVKKSAKGEILIDPKLFAHLQAHLSSPGSEEAVKAIESINVDAIKSALEGKLSDLEHRLVDRETIVGIVRERIKDAWPDLDEISANLEKRVDEQFERKMALLDSKPLPSDVDSDEIVTKILAQLKEPLSAPTTSVPALSSINWANEASGAIPIIGLSSKTYRPPTQHWLQHFSFLGKHEKPHRVALSNDNAFGNCWPFSGSQGQFVVQLGKPVKAEYFGICHLSAAFQVDRSSAPATLEVYAIPDITQPDEGILLSRFRYDLDEADCQRFPVQASDTPAVRHYRLEVLDNHGRPDYTCLYQFAVY